MGKQIFNKRYMTKKEELDRPCAQIDGLMKDVLEGRMLGRKREASHEAKMIDDIVGEKPKPKGR